MSVRILHAADLHLDSPFEALTLAQAAQRRREQRDLLRALPELARAHGAPIILLAGDLLDSASPYPETAKALAETFAGCGAEVFLAPGNHDYYSAGAPYARLTFPENVHIFRSPRIEAVTLPELGVRVWGAAFTDSRCPGLLRGFSVPKQAGLLDVLCVHGEVGNPASAYNPVSAAELAASGLDYAAFGHVHRFGGVQRAGKRPAALHRPQDVPQPPGRLPWRARRCATEAACRLPPVKQRHQGGGYGLAQGGSRQYQCAAAAVRPALRAG